MPPVDQPYSSAGNDQALAEAHAPVSGFRSLMAPQRWSFVFDELLGSGSTDQRAARTKMPILLCPAINWAHKAAVAGLLGWFASVKPELSLVGLPRL